MIGKRRSFPKDRYIIKTEVSHGNINHGRIAPVWKQWAETSVEKHT